MKVIVAYSPDPIYIGPFILQLLQKYPELFIGVIQTKGRLVKRKSLKQQINYTLAILLILGLPKFVMTGIKMLRAKFRTNDEIELHCKKSAIPFLRVKSVNSPGSLKFLRELGPDVLFNQSHHIVKRTVLEIPRIGALNRHGAILPDYRGRLSPFWQLLNGESQGGLTFHLMDEGIDTGDIVYQKVIPIEKGETVAGLVDKIFSAAVQSFAKVAAMLDRPDYKDHLIANNSNQGRVFSTPQFKDAWRYRFGSRR